MVLDRQTVSNFHGGKYLVWKVRGWVRLQVNRKGGANAAVSGVFFGSALKHEQAQPSLIVSQIETEGSVELSTQMPSHDSRKAGDNADANSRTTCWIISLNHSSKGAAEVVVGGIKVRTYCLEASDDLITWKPVGTNVNVEGAVRFIDEDAPKHPCRFYRAVEVH